MAHGEGIRAEDLRAMLERGEPVTVLDIRRSADREWTIPGSVHVDAYDALNAGDGKVLDTVDLPTDRPVVTVCGRGGTCVLLDGRTLFTGDTLFLSSVGRPDLEEPDPARIETHARMLYRSLERFLELPPETLVLPGHTGEPVAFDGRPLAVSLAEVRARSPLLGQPEDAFVAAILQRIPETPPNYRTIVEWNAADRSFEGDATELEAGANRCAVG
ncbi:rhodanese-like domain-containing protein [Limnochorda pilosa]|uniref:Rhodanese domain-containing protein n=1 Tax=Limnochorda pilosa TaxID=1555112 RepID=A0A0K2SQ03_LIMPI|nr:rhodanese-like domain-containing protein [Limnochorda pilosa]BAS29200.1 hypothetical protein LIP_3388 [Limnochorda pilosa]